MTQKELDRRYTYATYLFKHARSIRDAAEVFISETVKEQNKLDSLVHFCQTGKFLEYERLDHK